MKSEYQLVQGFFWGNKHVLELDTGYGCTAMNAKKTTELYTFKRVNFIIYELYINFFKKSPQLQKAIYIRQGHICKMKPLGTQRIQIQLIMIYAHLPYPAETTQK